mgnify:CR=1 FL=1
MEDGALAIEGPDTLDRDGMCCSEIEGGVEGTGGKAIGLFMSETDSTYNDGVSKYD